MSVRIVTDSAAVVPPGIGDELHITTVPIHLRLGGVTYRDGVDLAPDDFYRRVAAGEEVTTGTPSPGDYAAAFGAAFDAGATAILVPTVASRLSAIPDAVRVAAREFPDREIRVLDTGTAVTGSGLVTIEAATVAAGGASLDDVEAAAQRVVERVQLLAMLQMLGVLARSGKVSRVPMTFARLVGAKPVIRLIDADVRKEAVAFTTQGGLRRMVRALPEGPGVLRVGVFHAVAPEEARELAAMAVARRPDAWVFTTTFSPSMGAHTGPGVVGLAWWLDS